MYVTHATEKGRRSLEQMCLRWATGPERSEKLGRGKRGLSIVLDFHLERKLSHPTMKSKLPKEKAKANLCGRRAIIGGDRKRKENRKHTLDPARQAKKPRNLQGYTEMGSKYQKGDSRKGARPTAPLPPTQAQVCLLLVTPFGTTKGNISANAICYGREIVACSASCVCIRVVCPPLGPSKSYIMVGVSGSASYKNVGCKLPHRIAVIEKRILRMNWQPSCTESGGEQGESRRRVHAEQHRTGT